MWPQWGEEWGSWGVPQSICRVLTCGSGLSRAGQRGSLSSLTHHPHLDSGLSGKAAWQAVRCVKSWLEAGSHLFLCQA